MAARERQLMANGLRHHVLEWGEPSSAPSVVLCHGFLDIAWGYRDVAERLSAQGWHALAFDWRGHGETERIGKGGYYHFPDYVLDLHALLPQLTPRPCHLVGHSMGGTACCMFAAARPEALVSLALLEGMGPPEMAPMTGPARIARWLEAVDRARSATSRPLADVDEAFERLRRRTPDLPEPLGRLLAEKSTEPHPDGRGRRFRFDPLHRTPSAFGFDAARFMEFLAAIEAPTLCVSGSRGMRTGDDEQRFAALQQATHVQIDDTGHMLQWTAPEALCDALNAFWQAL